MDAINKWETDEEIDRMTHLLRQQAVTDELTGLHNRQGYYSAMRSIVANKGARDKNYAFVYIDLDHFKYYNDTFGHHVGDAILISFANIFRRMAPEGAKVIRLGGDEFAIILRYENRNEVVDMSRNILAEIEKAKGFGDVVEHIAFKSVTLEEDSYAGCSIGIAYLDGVRSEEDFETAQNNADAALYYVKEHGRNSYMEFKN
jgi:diguanylate cyclase (GGDEF)-like protein